MEQTYATSDGTEPPPARDSGGAEAEAGTQAGAARPEPAPPGAAAAAAPHSPALAGVAGHAGGRDGVTRDRLQALHVPVLRRLLRSLGITCRHCLEKSDLVDAILQAMVCRCDGGRDA